MKNFRIYSEVLKQFKDLTCKEEKLFYYAYGRFFVRHSSIAKNTEYDESGVPDMNLTINISYDEIQCLCDVKRVDRNNFKNINNKLLGNSFIDIIDESKSRKISIYEEIIFDNVKRQVEVTFTESAVKLFKMIDEGFGYTNILIEDIKNIENTFDLKLYLYCMTMYRKREKIGIVSIGIDEVRDSINPNASCNDSSFYNRYVKEVCKRINSNNKLKYVIEAKKEKGNIKFIVKERE